MRIDEAQQQQQQQQEAEAEVGSSSGGGGGGCSGGMPALSRHESLLREAGTASINNGGSPPPAGLFRWVVVALMGLAGVLVIWTRTAQSVAIIPWAKECHWSNSQKQLQLSAFFYGYVGSMWLGPILCTRLGGHRAFGLIVVCAVVSQALGPLAGCNPVAAGAVRVLVGAFEGPFYPASAFVIGRWFTDSEYSRAQIIMTVGATVGSLVGFPASSTMCDQFNWRWSYYLPSLMGPIWLVLWAILAASSPAESHCIGRAEQRYLASAVRSADRADGSPVRVAPLKLMCNAPVLAVTLCNFASAWASYTLMTELPSYLGGFRSTDSNNNAQHASPPTTHPICALPSN